MSNKQLLSLLLLIGILIITGCKTKEIPTKDRISKTYQYYNNIKCQDINNIIDLDFGGFVTKNKAFELNIEKLYSNDTNCKEVTIDNLDSELIRGSGRSIVYTKGKQYGIGKNFQKNVSENNEYKLFSTLGNQIIYNYSTSLKGYYTVSVDNKIKMIKPSGGDGPQSIKNQIDLKDSFASDEEVLTISDNFIKTNKGYYKVKAYKENKKECEKYIDIKCKYGFKIEKEKTLTDNYKDILFAGYYIIDKDYNVYKTRR